jgi:hypothetical protein
MEWNCMMKHVNEFVFVETYYLMNIYKWQKKVWEEEQEKTLANKEKWAEARRKELVEGCKH